MLNCSANRNGQKEMNPEINTPSSVAPVSVVYTPMYQTVKRPATIHQQLDIDWLRYVVDS